MTSSSGDERAWRAAWGEALDALELDVARAEGLLRSDAAAASPAPAWAPPQLPGPLPEDLRGRAGAILERQTRVAEGLSRAMAGNRRHTALTSRMGSGVRDPRVPAFVDQGL